jgi:hypothetical protein
MTGQSEKKLLGARGLSGAAVAALAAHVPMPPAVTRDAVMRLDRAALDQWWDGLGVRDAGWWRKWKRELPNP